MEKIKINDIINKFNINIQEEDCWTVSLSNDNEELLFYINKEEK